MGRRATVSVEGGDDGGQRESEAADPDGPRMPSGAGCIVTVANEIAPRSFCTLADHQLFASEAQTIQTTSSDPIEPSFIIFHSARRSPQSIIYRDHNISTYGTA